MREHTKNGLPVSLDARLRLAFHGTRLTSNAGLLVAMRVSCLVFQCGGRTDYQEAQHTQPACGQNQRQCRSTTTELHCAKIRAWPATFQHRVQSFCRKRPAARTIG